MLADLPLADPAVRIGAAFIDIVIGLVVLAMVAEAISALTFVPDDLRLPIVVLVGLALSILGVKLETSRLGTTPGKLLFGLKVVDLSGGPISVGQCLMRHYARPSVFRAFFMEMGEGDVLSHDRFTRTRVVRASALRRLKDEARARRAAVETEEE